MKANQITIITILIWLGGFGFVYAQEQDERLTREMTIEREYDPTIQDANKINRLPEVKELQVTKRSIEYSPFTIPANPDKEITVLPAGEIMTAIPFNKRRGYFNFGGGMYTNLNGDFGYHLLNDERDKLNIYFSHRSTNGDVEYLQYEDIKQKAKFNDNIGGLDFKHFFDLSTLRIGANYTYSLFNYYGTPFDLFSPPHSAAIMWPDSLADRQTNQVNQTINAYAGIQSNEYSNIGYLLDFDFIRFAQKYGIAKEFDGISENKYTLRLGLSSRFGDGTRTAGIAGRLNYFNYENTYPAVHGLTDSLGYQNYMEMTATPYIQFDGDVWTAKLGVNLMMITGDTTQYFLSPNILIEAEVADKTIFYVDAGGEIQSNDAHSLSKRNRYMNFIYRTKPSRTWLDATIGIRTGVVQDLWLDFFAGYKITQDEVFFVPSTVRGPLYGPYSARYGWPLPVEPAFYSYYTAFQTDASLFRAGVALKYMHQKTVDFSVKSVYNQWMFSASDDANNVKAFGRPAIEVNADLTVRPVNPLALTLGYYLGADRYTTLLGQEIKMEDIYDLNFTASWNFNKAFGVYLKLNNLLFQKQELHYGYPMQGFNAIAGINLNF